MTPPDEPTPETTGNLEWYDANVKTPRVLELEARIEALERERVAYLKALCQEDAYVIERVTRRTINMRDKTTPELADGLTALAQEIADREALEDVARDVVADLTRSRFILVQEDGTRNDATDLESVQRLVALREEE